MCIRFLYLVIGTLLTVNGLLGNEPDSSETGPNSNGVRPAKMTLSLWGEFYDESMIFQMEQNNLFSNSHIRQGLKISQLPAVNMLQTYVLLRYGRDLHRDFWNNKTEIGLGFRARFFQKVFLAPYVETIWGYYNRIPEDHPQPETKRYSDLRGGFIFWYGWDKWYSPASLVTFPNHFIGEIYSELNYFRKDRDNIIFYTHMKAGFRLIRIWKCALVGYTALYALKDKNKDFWNNIAEMGPGFWIIPHPDFDLKFFVEWLQGYYYGIEGRDENPNAQKFNDRRIGILLWIGW